jgi:hypothetical protein
MGKRAAGNSLAKFPHQGGVSPAVYGGLAFQSQNGPRLVILSADRDRRVIMLKLFVIEDVSGEPTCVEEWLRNHVAGIPGADHPIRVESVAGMVAVLLGQAMAVGGNTGPAGTIQTLFIAGHGSAGEQSVGIGDATDNTGAKVLKGLPNGRLMGLAASQLPAITPLFASNAVVTLGGCEVGSGPKGDFLLKAVSAALGGIAVQAATASQCSFMGPSGSVKRCVNGVVTNLGKLSAWPGPVVAAPGAAPVGGIGAVTSGGVGAVASPSLGR